MGTDDKRGKRRPFVSGSGSISTNNSSTATLTSGSTFTGTADDVSRFSSISFTSTSDVISATSQPSFEFSPDGTNWDRKIIGHIVGKKEHTHTLRVTNKFFRIVYTNGSTNQTSFRLQTIFN